MKHQEKEKLFAELFAENKAKIYRLCYAYLNDKSDIEDLFQEIMINVWNSLDKFRGDSKISTWLYRIAINTAFLFNKKSAKKNQLFATNLTDSTITKAETSSTQDHDKAYQIKLLHQCIEKLKVQDRIIISLMFEGLKYNEIAEVCGLTSNHIGVRINRIKPVLLKLMKEVQHG